MPDKHGNRNSGRLFGNDATDFEYSNDRNSSKSHTPRSITPRINTNNVNVPKLNLDIKPNLFLDINTNNLLKEREESYKNYLEESDKIFDFNLLKDE